MRRLAAISRSASPPKPQIYLFPAPRFDPYISELSLNYLRNMRELCRQQGARFRVIPNPISESAGKNFDRLKAQIRENGLEDIFSDFFERIIILPNDSFRDGIHMTEKYLNESKGELLTRIGIYRDSEQGW